MPHIHILSVLMLFITVCADAQTRDSVYVEYSTETPDSSRVRLKQAFRYITRATVEEKTLVKLGGIAPLPSYFDGIGAFGSVGLLAGIEHKLLPSVSVQVALINRYS